VSFYSKLPKGPAPAPSALSLKARLFDGKNASGAPLVAGLVGIFLLGYTLDYQSACFAVLECGLALMGVFASRAGFGVYSASQ
jgi:hypothetical protein